MITIENGKENMSRKSPDELIVSCDRATRRIQEIFFVSTLAALVVIVVLCVCVCVL